jgi:hypothetical protein
VPPTALALFGVYISLALWCFGSQSALIVHPTYCNAWASMFLGSAAQLGALFFARGHYLAASSVGEFLLLVGLMYTFR